MVKKYIRTLLIVSSLLSAFQSQVKSEGPSAYMIDMESFLRPHELSLLERNEAMVYMTPALIEVIKKISSEVPEVKELASHVEMGYTIATCEEVSSAIEYAIKASEAGSVHYAILKDYQQALINGDAFIRDHEIGNRRKKTGKFCNLFVQGCATIGNLTVRCNENVLGNLNVNGTVSAANFTFTGSSGCTGPATFPGLSSCGNVLFNTASTPLNAQGALEQNLNLVRATVSLGIPNITLIPTTPTPGAALNVGVTIPTSPTVTEGTGLSVGTLSGRAFSSGMTTITPIGGTLSYYFVVDLQIPLDFGIVYAQPPSITQATQAIFPTINSAGASVVDANSFSTVTVEISNVTIVSATLNILFNVIAQGTSYADAANNATIAINNIISNPVTTNALSINLIVDGPVA